jgi:hypothetical protein
MGKPKEIEVNTIPSKLIVCGVLFVITAVSGIVLSNAGKPLNSAIFTVHKLVAIGTIILLGVSLYQLLQGVDLRVLYVTGFAFTGVAFLALLVSGALLSLVDATILSLDQGALQAVLKVHQIAPLLALAASTLSVYLLAGRQA